MELIAFDSLITLAAGSMLGTLTNVLSVGLGLGMVIFFHELGHFAVAKWCGVHVERFSIGIGPIIWSRQKGETEYALSALPFGGYVKMLGQDDMDPNQMTSDEIAENPRSYSAKKVWQRMAIISAGVIMNVITGCLFFSLAYAFGVVETVPMVGSVHPGSPAWQLGIREGDTIESIDGGKIRDFTDINQAIVLADGPVTIAGKHSDGSEFSTVVTPRQGKDTQFVGIGPASTSKLASELPEGESISMPGMPSEKASQPFLPGDHITAMNGQKIEFFHDMLRLTAAMADQEIAYTVERPTPPGSTASSHDTLEITVPPMNFRSVGVWMAIGEITALQKDSIAEKAGLKLGDQITMVDELTVGRDLDPLRRPNYFTEHAGQAVKVTVKRQTDNGKADIELTMTPDDSPAWMERPLTIADPLVISSIGAGFHIQDRIAKVIEGSELAQKEPRIVEGQKISKVELQHPDVTNIVRDAFGELGTPYVIDFEKLLAEQELGTVAGINWAWIFLQIQQTPNRQVRLFIAPGTEGTDGFATLLEKREPVEGWFLPLRGIPYFERYVHVRKAESLADAAALGVYQTRNTGFTIYMTLRSLFKRKLSARSFSGPLGILRIGLLVADSGMTQLLKFLGFLSINLAVLNFLPIPVLDGGHMVFLIWEAVARKKPSPTVIGYAHGIGLIFIISLFVFVLYLDIFVNRLGFGGS
ncbi:MAG: RIP metalloprotease RseP [Planctomycetaceae bacterium]